MSAIKTIDKLPMSILIYIAREFAHPAPEDRSRIALAEFISNSLGDIVW